jgi:hypothetical protein
MLESMGWENKKAFDSQFLWEYAFGTYKDGFQKYSMPLKDANDIVWRRILNNLPYILKHKGTGRAMKAIMACYGVPQSMLTIMEFGGPQDPTKGGSTKFTFDDRTAAIQMKSSSSISIPWHELGDTGLYPQSIEFRIKPDIVKDTRIISSSQFNLDIIQTTGSYARLDFKIGDSSVQAGPYFEATSSGNEYITSSIVYVLGPDTFTSSLDFPLSTENYSNVLLNKYTYGSSTLFEVILATSDGNRITTYASMSLLTAGAYWESGSSLSVGNTFSGSLGAMAAIDSINAGQAATYIGAGAIITNLLATNAIMSINYSASLEAAPYSNFGTFIDLSNGAIRAPGFAIQSSGNASFRGKLESVEAIFGAWELDANSLESSNGRIKLNAAAESITVLDTSGNPRFIANTDSTLPAPSSNQPSPTSGTGPNSAIYQTTTTNGDNDLIDNQFVNLLSFTAAAGGGTHLATYTYDPAVNDSYSFARGDAYAIQTFNLVVTDSSNGILTYGTTKYATAFGSIVDECGGGGGGYGPVSVTGDTKITMYDGSTKLANQINECLRINLLAVIEEAKKTNSKIPFIINIPNAFLARLNDEVNISII